MSGASQPLGSAAMKRKAPPSVSLDRIRLNQAMRIRHGRVEPLSRKQVLSNVADRSATPNDVIDPLRIRE